MVLLIDNYDSFSYNLYQLVGELNPDIKVMRNDELTIEEIEQLHPTHIILSPGPGKPKDAGICESVITQLGKKYPILGVCLGHQAICEACGGEVSYAARLMHGKQSEAELFGESKLFQGLPKKIKVARYHSLSAVKEKLPKELVVTAVSGDGEIMAVEHKDYPVYGVQFHPESILTPEGRTILKNFMEV